MSNLGDGLDSVLNQFRAIQDHGHWREVHEESFLPTLKSILNDTASQDALDSLSTTVSQLPTEDTTLSPSGVVQALRDQSILNSDDEVAADVNNQNTTSVTSEVADLSVSGAINGPSVATVADLPDTTGFSVGASIYVEDEGRTYRLEGQS